MDSKDSSRLPLDALRLMPMASGHLSLNLTERIGWGEFGEYADELLRILQGRAVKATEGVDMRLWSVTVEGQLLRLIYEDYPAMVSLESCDAGGDVVLRRVELTLRNLGS